MIVTVDDLCLSYLDNFKFFNKIKEKQPNFKMIAFTIGNFKNNELLVESSIFKKWFEAHKNWVEIGVHAYDHDTIPDGDRDNEEHWIKKALESLKPFLPKNYGYRSPGWQTTNQTVPILKKLGFSYIAYQNKVKDLENNKILTNQILNSHLYNENELQNLNLKEVSYEILQDYFEQSTS